MIHRITSHQADSPITRNGKREEEWRDANLSVVWGGKEEHQLTRVEPTIGGGNVFSSPAVTSRDAMDPMWGSTKGQNHIISYAFTPFAFLAYSHPTQNQLLLTHPRLLAAALKTLHVIFLFYYDKTNFATPGGKMTCYWLIRHATYVYE